MVTEIVVVSISSVFAVLIAAIAYIQAKRLMFFETFFKRKADTFEEFITAIGSIPRDENELYNLSAITRKVTLYCFEDHKQPILDLLENGYVPVISTTACDDEGNVYNINADTAAAKLATALNAEKLILLTDVRGLLRDPKDESTLIPDVNVSEVPKLIRDGIISGGMIPKIDCCVEAVRSGVQSAIILDGRVQHSILIELLSNEGIGTMLTQ